MKSLPLKLGIFIIALFGFVILGFVLYEPLWWKWQEAKLQSDDKAEREAAIETIAARGGSAVPMIREWLKRRDDNLVLVACRILMKLDNEHCMKAVPELEEILRGNPSEKTYAAAEIIYRVDIKKYIPFDFSPGAGDRIIVSEKDIPPPGIDKAIVRNIALYALQRPGDYYAHEIAMDVLENIKDVHVTGALCGIIKSCNDDINKESAAYILSVTGGDKALDVLLEQFLKEMKPGRFNELNSSEPGAGNMYFYSIVRLGRKGERYVKKILSRFETDTDKERLFLYAKLLGEIGNPAALKPLIKRIDGFENIIIDALGEIRHPDGIEPIMEKLEEKRNGKLFYDVWFRENCARALGKFEDVKAADILIKMVERDDFTPAISKPVIIRGNSR